MIRSCVCAIAVTVLALQSEARALFAQQSRAVCNCVCGTIWQIVPRSQANRGGLSVHAIATRSKNQEQPVFSDACSQSDSERTANLDEAEKNGYAIRRVDFLGNYNTRDIVLRRRILLEEGEPLTREKIEESLKRLSQLKTIYPLRFSNVEIQLDMPNKIADLAICVTEKRKQK